jgi:hypothetical protein
MVVEVARNASALEVDRTKYSQPEVVYQPAQTLGLRLGKPCTHQRIDSERKRFQSSDG